ncbi:hypothetical protein [Chamaesiphon polymorphus]|uniref:hypothetical protein n=1 Tax=Chamaesiphon polymorphus TaxID=2107691 RepID=UPI0015E63C06|nr:hypothetical protein [Chamaesiphon polymorphus]
MNHQNFKFALAENRRIFSPLEMLGFALLYPTYTYSIPTTIPNNQLPIHHPYHA